MKLLYYLPAFGEGKMDIKGEILLHNLEYIFNDIKQPFSICLNMYTNDELLKLRLSSLEYLENIYVYEKKGVLTELFLTNPANIHVDSFDYIFFCMDDVKIENINFQRMIELKEKYNIEILSPKVTNATHSFMYECNNLTINNFLEVYCMLMNPENFRKYLSINTVENKWTWGVDLLFGFHKIKVGVLNIFEVNHFIKDNASNQNEATALMINYIQQVSPFSNHFDIWQAYDPIIETIVID
jgi:hypothetical protein